MESYMIILVAFFIAGICMLSGCTFTTQPAQENAYAKSAAEDQFIQPMPLCDDMTMCYRYKSSNAISCFPMGSTGYGSTQWMKYCQGD